MKRIVIFSLLLLTALSAVPQSGYQISITVKPYKNQYIYLGYHYGKLKALADSVRVNANGTGVLAGKQKLPGGIYFLVSPRKEILFEFLLDQKQHFSINADTASLPNSISFTGSADNTLFQSYTGAINILGREIGELQASLRNAPSKTDSASISAKLQTLNAKMQQTRNELESKYPASMLAALFRAMKEPVVPPAEQQPGNKYDSVYAYNYFKSHYWDGVSFTDERLLRTPIFEPKLEKYFRDLVAPVPDSITKEIDRMLLNARSNKEMFRFLLTHFVQKYIDPQYMGQDAVFVHLFEKYINNNPEVDWFTAKYSKHMSDRAYSLMANLIGAPASNLEMVDSSGKASPLYAVKAPFTVVCFWDPTCSHCKEVVPKVDSMFRAKWKAMGVKVYGVMVDGGKEAWTKFIRENNLAGWIHVYETPEHKEAVIAAGQPGYKQLYDVYQTPVLYLLDADKRIIAKKLNYQQLDEVMTLKSKTAASK